MSLIELVRPCEAVAIGCVSAENTSGQVSNGATKRGSTRLLRGQRAKDVRPGRQRRGFESVEGGSNRCKRGSIPAW